MFPERPRAGAPTSERRVYEQLARTLDDRFVVFHSLAWHGRGKKPDGEADFVIAHPDLGMLVLEVKGGGIAHDPVRGKWTSQDAFNVGAPIPTINTAVTERILSSLKDERVIASTVLPSGTTAKYTGDKQAMIDAVRQALYASKISAYAQGMAMLRIASNEYGYNLDLAECAAIWRAGCIIRARFLNRITAAFQRNPALANLLLDEELGKAVTECLPAWRHVVKTAVEVGIPAPAFSASLAYYDSYRSANLPANLIQAQRDYFGAHTYERTDKAGTFHSNWG